MPSSDTPAYVLGIDLGSASLGWALVALDHTGNACGLLRAGVRTFDPGVEGTDLAIQQGRDESSSAKRRQMRLQRRHLRRRAARQRELFELLQQHALLPPYPETIPPQRPHVTNAQKSEMRHALLNALDLDLSERWKPRMTALPAAAHVLPYFLRATALSERLEPHEVGRALYHLGQRRGFKSNRREIARTKEQEKEKSKVYAGITEIESEMRQRGAQTLGSFFASLDPTDEKQKRIRNRWTARSMFEGEFDAIWKAQASRHPQLLTPELRNKIRHLLFFQRPIAKNTQLVGECELEPGRKRAPMACLDAQRFRLLQKVNDLTIRLADFSERRLTDEERTKLLDALEREGDKSFAELRALLGLPKRGVWFNLERGGEKKIPGNRTNSKMLSAFGERWNHLTPEERDEIVEAWRTAETEEWLVRRAVTKWGLDEERARQLAKFQPEDGYVRLSHKALSKLLPMMEDGFPFKEAEKEIYGTRFSGGHVAELLPPVRDELLALRNPAVERALTELRKVVNAIVREHGKPFEIHIELARDLKRSREDRKITWKLKRERQGQREKAAAQILSGLGRKPGEGVTPSHADKEKYLLWEECGQTCPYTGREISFTALFGENPQFDFEHILPFSRCPDDSFANKTLCYHDENRTVKRGRTPWEAYGGDAARWSEILERVKRFKNPGKLKRFQVKSDQELDEFSARQLNDTRYASKLAARYLGALYGGRDVTQPDGSNRRAILASPGGLTAILRRHWQLEAILREAEPAASEEKAKKRRSDHRHHAIDALVIALSSLAAVKALADAAERNAGRGRTSFRGLEAPWPDFVSSVRPHIENLIVSHRPEHKLTGQLHDETLYSPSYEADGKTYVHVRKPVDSLTAGEIEHIVDPVVRKAVQNRLKEVGDLKKLQTAGVPPPYLESTAGRRIPIRRVRIRKALTTVPVAEGPRRRNVALNNNHHMEVIATLDEQGREIRWDGVPVSLLEGTARRRKGVPVVERKHGSEEEARFKFSLMGKDTIEVRKGEWFGIYVVRTIASNGQISLARVNDARLKEEMRKANDWWSPRADALRKAEARKVVVDVLGKVHPAND
jgi:CRISPR-associated endonuclease Csn1